MTEVHYRKPGWFTKHVFNQAVGGLTKLGVSVLGSRVLEVKGRKSGEPRRVPVNLLKFEGAQYLVSARGVGDWVLNVEAAGELDLVVGRHRQHYRAVELADTEKNPVLRSYLERWKAEVGVFFDGVDANSSDADLQAIAPKHPVFRLEPAGR
jgi:deazaflavin-dependent oxidoreductase (nitroreductase family)